MTLGDRVAVLRPVSFGRPYNLQQVGPPTELFNRPANVFVAGFIGSPAMKLIYAKLEANGDDVGNVRRPGDQSRRSNARSTSRTVRPEANSWSWVCARPP